ncbi:chitinase [Aspergillus sclerotialis]|uniref:chitinase n=1 Tax=Aspergillus sclerotialis TaxID=2070753 RepID=A0A3A2Z7S7_9EURO|nr:chitinase [Aspergillus sclerotialis]
MMVFNGLLAAATAVSVLTPAVSATFDAQAKTNVATYYGQGFAQERLRHFCEQTSLDIINLGFLNVFPDQGLNGFPGTNFGNQCGSETFEINGKDTELLSNCRQLVEDIPICQALGKKVFLSLGGTTPDNQKIKDEDSAKAFANFLWLAFGPPTEEWAAIDGPRPFKNITLDGFDFDVEHNGGSGYATMINTLRERFAEFPERKFYISGAPQCPIPDDQLSDAIANAPFDFIWVQFYNNPACSAGNYGNGDGFNYDQWMDVIKNSANPAAKLYVGLPGNPFSAQLMDYLTPSKAELLVSHYMDKYPENFGGIMLWDATSQDLNVLHGRTYGDHMKEILMGCAPPVPTPTPSTTSHSVTRQTSSTARTGSSTVVTATSSSFKPPSSTSPTGSSTGLTTTPSSSGKPTSSTSPTGSSTGLTTTPSSTGKPTDSGTPSGSSVPSLSHSHTTSKPVIPTTTTSTSSTGSSSSTHISSGKPSSTPKPTVSPTGSGSSTITSGITSGTTTVASTGSSSVPETITTVIVTEYISICPTGFTTITTSYTTTYCPGTVSATPTPTGAPSSPTGAFPQTTSASLPEGWTTTVTVCTQCAPTPTTVTLTVPCESTATTSADSQPSGSSPNEGGSGAQPTTTAIIIPVPSSSSRPSSTPGDGRIHPSAAPSKTFSFRPSTSASRVPTAPSNSQGGNVPLATGSASRLGMTNVMVFCLSLLLSAIVMG